MQWVNVWLSFIQRGDIQATMVLTAIVSKLRLEPASPEPEHVRRRVGEHV